MKVKMLTKREVEVLRLYAQGATTQEVAKKLEMSAHTVDSHKRNMINKCAVKNIVELAVLATKEGWILQ